jgi:hypothetical protein
MSTVRKNTRARTPLAIGLAAALTLGGVFGGGNNTASAAPLSLTQMAANDAVPDNVVEVGRRHRSGHAIAGLALGIISAAIIAHEYKRYHRRYDRRYYHSYHPHYYYGPPSCIRKYGAVYCR